MDNQTRYNGWTNYQTWRISLEWFDNAYLDDVANNYEANHKERITAYEMAIHLEAFINEMFEDRSDNDFMPYAYWFISQVNYYEIAENYLS